MARKDDEKKGVAPAGNPVSRAVGYVQDSWEELKKVHPPSRKETIQGAVGVLVMVFFFGVFLGFSDWVVGSFMQYILT